MAKRKAILFRGIFSNEFAIFILASDEFFAFGRPEFRLNRLHDHWLVEKATVRDRVFFFVVVIDIRQQLNNVVNDSQFSSTERF